MLQVDDIEKRLIDMKSYRVKVKGSRDVERAILWEIRMDLGQFDLVTHCSFHYIS